MSTLLHNYGLRIAVTGDDVRGLRDHVLLRLAYDSMRRRSEVVAVLVEDLTQSSTGSGSVLLRFSKTDPEGEGRTVRLSADTIAVINEWLQQSGITEGKIPFSLFLEPPLP